MKTVIPRTTPRHAITIAAITPGGRPSELSLHDVSQLEKDQEEPL
jgi:hypothetical protein